MKRLGHGAKRNDSDRKRRAPKMKRLGRNVRRFVGLLTLVLLLFLLSALPAVGAGPSIDLDVDGCHLLNSAVTSCDVEVKDGTGRQVGQRSCPLAGGGFACRFTYPATPGATTVAIDWYSSGAVTGAVCWRVSIGCASTDDSVNAEYAAMTFGATSTASGAAPTTATRLVTTSIASVAVSNGAGNKPCEVKVERVDGVGGCTNNMADTTGRGALPILLHLTGY